MQYRLHLLALALAACGNSGSPGTPTSNGSAAQPTRTASGHTVHKATVDGVKFSVTVPPGVTPDPGEAGVWNGDDLRVFAIVIDTELVTSLDKAKYQSTLHMQETKFVRAEEKAGGYRLTSLRPSGEMSAISFSPTPNGWLKCKATTSRDARPLVESICDSVAVE